MDTLVDALLKAIPTAAIAVLTLAASWVVTNRVSAKWELYRKRRELDLAAASAFYAGYGEFFAIWKIWSGLPRADGIVQAAGDVRFALLERAAAMEGALESLLVKLATERNLSDEDAVTLACFREGMQCLRESIEKNVPLRTRSSERSPREWTARGGGSGRVGAAYGAFKDLAGAVALIVTTSPEHRKSRDHDDIGRVVRSVTTSAQYRETWWRIRS
jgi:hypothetical protein